MKSGFPFVQSFGWLLRWLSFFDTLFNLLPRFDAVGVVLSFPWRGDTGRGWSGNDLEWLDRVCY